MYILASETDALDRYAPLLGCGHVKFPPIGHLSTKSTVERILLTYLRTLLTYRKLPFADKLWTLEKNKGHFIILELNSGIIKWPLFFSKVHSLSDIDRLKGCAGRLKGCALRYVPRLSFYYREF